MLAYSGHNVAPLPCPSQPPPPSIVTITNARIMLPLALAATMIKAMVLLAATIMTATAAATAAEIAAAAETATAAETAAAAETAETAATARRLPLPLARLWELPPHPHPPLL